MDAINMSVLTKPFSDWKLNIASSVESPTFLVLMLTCGHVIFGGRRGRFQTKGFHYLDQSEKFFTSLGP